MLQKNILILLLMETTFLHCNGMLLRGPSLSPGTLLGNSGFGHPPFLRQPFMGAMTAPGFRHPLNSPLFGPMQNPPMNGVGVSTVYEPRSDGTLKPVTRYHTPDSSVITRKPGHKNRKEHLSPAKLPKRKHQNPLPIIPLDETRKPGKKHSIRKGELHEPLPIIPYDEELPSNDKAKKKTSQKENENDKKPQKHTNNFDTPLPILPYLGKTTLTENPKKKKTGQEKTYKRPLEKHHKKEKTKKHGGQPSAPNEHDTGDIVKQMQEALENDPAYRKQIRDALPNDPNLKKLVDENPVLKKALKHRDGEKEAEQTDKNAPEKHHKRDKTKKHGGQPSAPNEHDTGDIVKQMQEALENDPAYRKQIRDALPNDPNLKKLVDENPVLKKALKHRDGEREAEQTDKNAPEKHHKRDKTKKHGGQPSAPNEHDTGDIVKQMQEALENDPAYRKQIRDALPNDPNLKKLVDENPVLKKALKHRDGEKEAEQTDKNAPEKHHKRDKTKKHGGQPSAPNEHDTGDIVKQMQEALENDPAYRKQIRDALPNDPNLKKLVDENPVLKKALKHRDGEREAEQTDKNAPEKHHKRDKTKKHGGQPSAPNEHDTGDIVKQMQEALENDPAYRKQIRDALPNDPNLKKLVDENPALKKALKHRDGEREADQTDKNAPEKHHKRDKTKNHGGQHSAPNEHDTGDIVKQMQEALENDPAYRKQIRDALPNDPNLKKLVDENPVLKKALKHRDGEREADQTDKNAPEKHHKRDKTKNHGGQPSDPNEHDTADIVKQMQEALENDPAYRKQIRDALPNDPNLKKLVDENPALKKALKHRDGEREADQTDENAPEKHHKRDKTKNHGGQHSAPNEHDTGDIVKQMQEALENDPAYRKQIRDALPNDPNLKKLVDENPALKKALKHRDGEREAEQTDKNAPDKHHKRDKTKNHGGQPSDPNEDDTAEIVKQMQEALENDPAYRKQILDALPNDPNLKKLVDENPVLKKALKHRNGEQESDKTDENAPEKHHKKDKTKNHGGQPSNPNEYDTAEIVKQMQEALENDPAYRKQIRDALPNDPNLKKLVDENPALKKALKHRDGEREADQTDKNAPDKHHKRDKTKNHGGQPSDPNEHDTGDIVKQMQEALENDPAYRKQIRDALPNDQNLKKLIDENPVLKKALKRRDGELSGQQPAPEKSERGDGSATEEEVAKFVKQMKLDLEQDPTYRKQIRDSLPHDTELNNFIEKYPELTEALNRRYST